MSKVPYTINIDRYICTELEYIRKMNENRDYSMLAATIERIQYHASSMEDALYRYEGIKYKLKSDVEDKDMTDADFRKKAVEVLKLLEK